MNLSLLLPAALAALASLLVPLLIHLARRSERRPTDFAALRWLQAQARPRRNLRFDEWPLLALRLLLLGLLALLLARPVLFGDGTSQAWIVAAPGVDAATLADATASGAGQREVRRHWLAPGFPPASAPAQAAPLPVSSLLRELDATLPPDTPLTVLVPAVLDDVDAERPRLSRPVEWRIVSDARAIASRPPRTGPMPTLVVRHADDRTTGLRYLRAAVAAWQAADRADETTVAAPAPGDAAIDIAGTGRPLPEDAALLAWLSPGPLPTGIRQWVEAGGVALLDSSTELPGLDAAAVRWRDGDGTALARGMALGRGQVLALTRPLTPARMPLLLDGAFPAQLRELLTPPAPPPARVAAVDHAPDTGAPAWRVAPRDVSPWLVVLVAALFLLERWMSASPRRRARA